MTADIAEHVLFDSCRVLFGSELELSRSFLEYLQRSGIKSAYRKKALETHPDILISQGDEAKAQCADLFRIVQQSYENLITYLDARDNGFRFQARPTRVQAKPAAAPPPPPPRPTQRPYRRTGTNSDCGQGRSATGQAGGATRSQPRPADTAWQAGKVFRPAAIPARKLLFGHFLYYAGVTNWQTIVKALVWQRTGRPRLGEIGRRFGWLTDQDILTILKRRNLSDSFGASAVALGLLTDRQLQLMLFQQNKLQKKFGEYYIHHKLLTETQIIELASQFSRHNTSYDRQRYSSHARM